MNAQAERFRIVTMKVLSMQLNSIIVMDVVAYGGSALGILFSLFVFLDGSITFEQCFTIIMLCADFFLPLRILGSYFHIAMNGMTASKKIFSLLDTEEEYAKVETIETATIQLKNLSFSYDTKEVLHDISIDIPQNSFISIVGKSGCGKSTIAGIIAGCNSGYTGTATINNNVTTVSANSYLFKGSVKENLLMAKPDATDNELWHILGNVQLSDFLKMHNGLETMLTERGSNFSGGQCQRIALARALLHDSPIYIFDEATSNIDVESEALVMECIKSLKKSKTLIVISHRLLNVVDSDCVYVLENGKIVEFGTHDDLLSQNGQYNELWSSQQLLENAQGGAK